MKQRHEWVTLDPRNYVDLAASRVEGITIGGQVEFVLARSTAAGALPEWSVYTVLHPERDGFSGLEAVGDGGSYEQARSAAEAMLEEWLAMPAG